VAGKEFGLARLKPGGGLSTRRACSAFINGTADVPEKEIFVLLIKTRLTISHPNASIRESFTWHAFCRANVLPVFAF